jgi:hypothetical protein
MKCCTSFINREGKSEKIGEDTSPSTTSDTTTILAIKSESFNLKLRNSL